MPYLKKPLWQSCLISIALATIANVLLLYALRPLVIDPMQPLRALSLAPVVTFTVFGAVGAALVFSLLRYYLENPDRIFIIVSIIFFVFSLVPDLLILHMQNPLFPGADAGTVGTLILMHIAAGVLIVWTLVRLTRPVVRENDILLLLPR